MEIIEWSRGRYRVQCFGQAHGKTRRRSRDDYLQHVADVADEGAFHRGRIYPLARLVLNLRSPSGRKTKRVRNRKGKWQLGEDLYLEGGDLTILIDQCQKACGKKMDKKKFAMSKKVNCFLTEICQKKENISEVDTGVYNDI